MIVLRSSEASQNSTTPHREEIALSILSTPTSCNKWIKGIEKL